MSSGTQLWLWIAFVGMVLGSVIFGLKAAAQRRKEGMEFALVSFFITLWAATMYLSMILGETVLFNFKGQHTLFWGRYVDWVITTPLLLMDLGVIAGARPKLIAGVLAADVFMIVTGAIATLEVIFSSIRSFAVSINTGRELFLLRRRLHNSTPESPGSIQSKTASVYWVQ